MAKQLVTPNLDPYLVQPDGKGGEYVLTNWSGYCSTYVEQAYGLKYLKPTAWLLWGASNQHTDAIPAGVYVPIFFSGYYGMGHASIYRKDPATGAISIWTSPLSAKPYADTYSSIGAIERAYGVIYVGWTDDLAGHKVVDLAADTAAPNQRITASKANARDAANTSANVFQVVDAGEPVTMKGYITNGEAVENDKRWYVTAISGKYMSFTVFTSQSTDGLPDLTPTAPAPTPQVPKSDLSPMFEKELSCVTSVAQVNVTNYQTDNFPTTPAGVVLHDFGTDGKDTLAGSLAHFKNADTTAPHFVVSGLQIIQTGKLSWRMYHAGPKGNDKIGIEIDPDCDTNIATQQSLKTLLIELDAKYGKLARYKHPDFMATACGDDVPTEMFSLEAMYPPATPQLPTTPTFDKENNELLKQIAAKLEKVFK